MIEPRFIHLRLHSAYSLLEGAIQVKALPIVAASMTPVRREFHFAKEITGAA